MAQAIWEIAFLENEDCSLRCMESRSSAPSHWSDAGGWITDNYLRWIFYINVPVRPGLALVYQLVEDPPYLAA